MPATPQEPIPADLPCAHCHYNLRSLPADSRCPECGTTVAHSIANQGRASLHTGRIILGSALLLVLAILPLGRTFILRSMDPARILLVLLLFQLPETLLFCSGSALLATSSRGRLSSQRKFVIAILLFILIFTCFEQCLGWLQYAKALVVPPPVIWYLARSQYMTTVAQLIMLVAAWRFTRATLRALGRPRLFVLAAFCLALLTAGLICTALGNAIAEADISGRLSIRVSSWLLVQAILAWIAYAMVAVQTILWTTLCLAAWLPTPRPSPTAATPSP